MKKKKKILKYRAKGEKKSMPMKYSDGREYVIPQHTGISEDDIEDLLELLPNGCKRRLFYKKTNVETDFNTGVFADKVAQDVLVANIVLMRYADAKQRHIRKCSRHYRSDLAPIMISYHPAYWIRKPSAKSMPILVDLLTEDQLLTIKDHGPSELLVYKLQHCMFVRETEEAGWGGVCFDYPEIAHADLTRDESIINRLRDAAQDFWHFKEAEQIPDVLPDGDRRCLFCTYKYTCHDVPIPKYNIHLDARVKRYVLISEAIKNLEDKREDMEKIILAGMSGKLEADTIYGKLSIEPTQKTTLDGNKMLNDHPELRKKYGIVRAIKKIKLEGWSNA